MSDEHTEARPAPLRGYRVLSDEEKAIVDAIKLMEFGVGKLWAEVYQHVDTNRDDPTAAGVRYALRAETLFRDGFMELVRAVTRPLDAYRTSLDELRKEDDRG